MRLIILDAPESPNKYLRMHWAARNRYWHKWQQLVRAEIDNSHKPCKRKMRVNISQLRRRKLDKDNLTGSCKPIYDALVHWKILKDDSEKWCEQSTPRQQIGPKKVTVIDILDAE